MLESPHVWTARSREPTTSIWNCPRPPPLMSFLDERVMLRLDRATGTAAAGH